MMVVRGRGEVLDQILKLSMTRKVFKILCLWRRGGRKLATPGVERMQTAGALIPAGRVHTAAPTFQEAWHHLISCTCTYQGSNQKRALSVHP